MRALRFGGVVVSERGTDIALAVDAMLGKRRPLALRLLDRILELHMAADLQRVLDFVASDKRQLLDTKADLCDIILKHLQRCAYNIATQERCGNGNGNRGGGL